MPLVSQARRWGAACLSFLVASRTRPQPALLLLGSTWVLLHPLFPNRLAPAFLEPPQDLEDVGSKYGGHALSLNVGLRHGAPH